MEYTMVKTPVQYVTIQELTRLQKDYVAAKKKGQQWIIQAMDRVFNDIDLGVIKVKETA
jgi:hypothetical protein